MASRYASSLARPTAWCAKTAPRLGCATVSLSALRVPLRVLGHAANSCRPRGVRRRTMATLELILVACCTLAGASLASCRTPDSGRLRCAATGFEGLEPNPISRCRSRFRGPVRKVRGVLLQSAPPSDAATAALPTAQVPHPQTRKADAKHAAASLGFAHDLLEMSAFNASDCREKRPLIAMRHTVVVHEDAVAIAAAVLLEWQGDQIANSSLRLRVLIREEPVVRVQSEIRPAFHRLRQDV